MGEPRSFGFIIKDIARLYGRRFEEEARSHGLTLSLSECKVLVSLARNEGVSQARLGELTEIEPMNLVRILDHMQSEGWLERRPDPVDRRARQLFLKPKSTPMIEEIWVISDAVRNAALAGIPPEHTQLLISLLETTHLNLLAPLAGQPATSVGAMNPAKSVTTRTPRLKIEEKS